MFTSLMVLLIWTMESGSKYPETMTIARSAAVSALIVSQEG
jgi:hypothetical protein